MNTFDLRGFLVENKLTTASRLVEEQEFMFEISNDEIEKIAAAALNVDPEQLEDSNEVDEAGVMAAIGLGFAVAGLVPPLLNAIAGVINQAKRQYKKITNSKDLGKLKEIDAEIKKTKELIVKLDKATTSGRTPEEKEAREKLHHLEHERDAMLGTAELKDFAHNWHAVMVKPISLILDGIAAARKKLGVKKKGKIDDPDYREKLANVIYAVIMLFIAGAGVAGHIKHLAGVGTILTTTIEAFKSGVSLADAIKGAAVMI